MKTSVRPAKVVDVQEPAVPVPAAADVIGQLSYSWLDTSGKVLVYGGPVTRAGLAVLMSYLSAAADYLDPASWWRWNEASPELLQNDSLAVRRVAQALVHAYDTMILLRFGWYAVEQAETQAMMPPVCPTEVRGEVARLVQNAVGMLTLFPFLALHVDRAKYMAMCGLVADEFIATN